MARIAVVVTVPAALLFVVELILRMAGVGYSTDFFVPSDAPGMLEPNPDFARQFYGHKTAARPMLFKMPASKPPGTRRIFVLGESAAAGTPDPGYSFSRILEVMLRQQFPEARFEIENVAMRGIDSTIIRQIARDCAGHQPDLFVVFMGNNDVIGLHGPEPGCSRWSQNLTAQRVTQALKSTRLGQLAFRALKRASPTSEEQDMEYFRKHRLPFDHWSREKVAQHFAANLHDILAAARRSGAGVVLATVPVNLRDCPPFESLHRPGLTDDETARWTTAYQRGIEAAAGGQNAEAVRHFNDALRIDDHFAELHYRLAEALASSGDTNAARLHFAAAQDRDALQFRSDSRINTAIREAAQYNGERVHLVDAEAAFMASPLAEHGVPGARLFNDHVHPTFDGDYLLASTLLGLVAESLGLEKSSASPGRAVPTRDECARALAFTPWDAINVEAAMVNFRSRPPNLDQADHARRQKDAETALQKRLSQFDEAALRQCAAIFQAALEQRPDDWPIRLNYGRLLQTLKQPAEAAAQFEILVKNYPRFPQFRQLLADALVSTGRLREALTQLEAARRLAPNDPQIPKLITRVQMLTSPLAPRPGTTR